jgi:hypothetical protein
MRYFMIGFRLSLCLLIGVGLLAACPTAHAAHEVSEGLTQDTYLTCKAAAYPSWSPEEKWVWLHLCVGEFADFKEYLPETSPDLKIATCSAKPIIRSSFIRTLLVDPNLRSILKPLGIKIRNARIETSLDLTGLELYGDFLINNSCFDQDVKLDDVTTERSISFDGSSFHGKLFMDSAYIGSSLSLNAVSSKAVHLGVISVGKQCTVVDSDIDHLNFYNSTIGANLHLNRSRFADYLSVSSAHLKKNLIMRGVDVKSVYITNTQIDGVLDIGFQGGPSARFPSNPWPRRYEGEREMRWDLAGEGLFLCGTRANILFASDDAWPTRKYLSGFQYNGYEVPATASGTESEGLNRKTSKQLIEWLENQSVFSSQPYEQLALVLAKQGESDKARAIRYAAKAAEHKRLKGWDWIFRTFSWLFIGYGYATQYVFSWVILFIVVGSIVFRSVKEVRDTGCKHGLSYSFDMLMPIIRLREANYNIDIKGWRRGYLYIHKLMGYILASFVIGSLSGLIK